MSQKIHRQTLIEYLSEKDLYNLITLNKYSLFN